MNLIRLSFGRKIQLTIAVMLILVLALAWLLFFTSQRYDHLLNRTNAAHHVLSGYIDLSNDLSVTLDTVVSNAIGEVNRSNEPYSPGIDLQSQAAAMRSLRETMLQLQENVTFEATIISEQEIATAHNHVKSFTAIQQLAERIITQSDQIQTSVAKGVTQGIDIELTSLRDLIDGPFKQAINLAMEVERAEIVDIQHAADALNGPVCYWLPRAMLVIVLVTILGSLFLSRRLTSSLAALHDGTRLLQRGELDRRIGLLREVEFSQVANTIDNMADALTTHRHAQEDWHTSLKETVAEKTHALAEANDKLAQVDQKRRRLLADISHELRTPLTVIRGEADIVLRGESRNASEYQDSLTRIVDQVDHTTRLVDDLLLIARADAGVPRLKLSRVVIANLIKSVCNDFSAAALRKHVTMVFEPLDDQVVFHGDIGRLRQVFAILIDNALRYCKSQGHIDITLGHNEEFILVSVRDDGIGLTEKDAEQVFERFYRGNDAEKFATGTGLGLPVARAIVEAHKGSITLVGEPGKGAEATITLPVTNKFLEVA